MDSEYAHDLGQNHKYLHENWIEPDNGTNTKYAFNGDIGTTLILDQPDAGGDMWGTIVKGIPEYFGDARIPDWSGFRYLQEYGFETLSNALRNAKDVNIQKDTYGEENVYRINFTLTGEKDQIDVEGKVIEFTRDGVFVAYVSPSKQFATVKIDLMRGPGSDDVIDSRVGTDFEEVSPDLWLPKRIDSKYVTITVKDLKNDVVLGDEARVISKIDFPSEAYVEDKIAGVEYRVGLSDAFVMSHIEENVERIDLARENKIELPDYNYQEQGGNKGRRDQIQETGRDVNEIEDNVLGSSTSNRIYLKVVYLITSLLGICAIVVVLRKRMLFGKRL
jgi:hypothetical protein